MWGNKLEFSARRGGAKGGEVIRVKENSLLFIIRKAKGTSYFWGQDISLGTNPENVPAEGVQNRSTRAEKEFLSLKKDLSRYGASTSRKLFSLAEG